MRPIFLTILAVGLFPHPSLAQSTTRPKLASTPVHYYPKDLQDHKARVVLQVRVTAEGRVDSTTIKVVRSTDPHFDEAARLTALATRFEPGYSQGGPVQLLVQQAITFEPNTQPCAFTVTPVLAPQCAESIRNAGQP